MSSAPSDRRSPRAAWRRVLTLSSRQATSPRQETPDQRLARLARWILDGRRRDALTSLREWRNLPPLGRDLLAMLTGPATALPQSLGLARLIHLARSARRRRARPREAGDVSQATRLADDLACREHLLPSLVAALRMDPRPEMIARLRLAVDRLAAGRRRRDLGAGLCLAAAELALLDGDRSSARRWAMRVSRIEPGNALAAKLLLRTAANRRQQRLADAALAASLAAHPEYRDLQALARRSHMARRQAA